MSAAENVVPLRRKLRSVDVFRRGEATAWEKVEAVYADVFDERPDLADLDASRSHGVNTGLKAAEDTVYAALVADGLDVKRNYLHDLYVMRRAWPPEERVEQASFRAHYLLRSQTYDRKRQLILERLAKKSKSGHVTGHAVKVYISERKPRHTWSFIDLVERRIRGSVKGAAAPWHLVAEEDRQAIADILHRIGAEVADGTFPKKAT